MWFFFITHSGWIKEANEVVETTQENSLNNHLSQTDNQIQLTRNQHISAGIILRIREPPVNLHTIGTSFALKQPEAITIVFSDKKCSLRDSQPDKIQSFPFAFPFNNPPFCEITTFLFLSRGEIALFYEKISEFQ